MKVLGITAARGGSKGVPNKNLKNLAGYPLIVWTVREARACNLLYSYAVTSDSEKILSMARKWGAERIYRSKELSRDDTPMAPVLIDAVERMEAIYGRYDIIADLRTTNPFKTAEDIRGAIQKLIDTGAESVIGVSPYTHPARIKYIEDDRIRDFYPEPEDGLRQNLPNAWIRNGSLYIVRRDLIMQGKWRGHEDSRPWYMPKTVNIDDENDWMLAERLMENVIRSRDR